MEVGTKALGLYRTDCEAVWSQIKHQEKQLRLKRRWLMGLPLDESELRKMEGPNFLREKVLSESMLREDDVFYDTVKMHVREALLSHDFERGCCVIPENVEVFDMHEASNAILSNLNNMTNEGLYHIAMLVTRGSNKFEKTRWKMKKIIQESVRKVFVNKKSTEWTNETLEKLYQLLNDSRNFRGVPPSYSQREEATKLLERLEEFPTQVLIGMYRKLRGVQGRVPQLKSFKSGRKREDLICKLRRKSRKVLLGLGPKDSLPEPLAKALSIAVLYLKLMPGFKSSTETEFFQFAPEIRNLQDQIVKAVWKLKSKVKIKELKVLQSLLGPNAKISNRGLRGAITKVLIEFLFECSDLDVIPSSLLKSVAVINQSSRVSPPTCLIEEEVEEEVECILGVSAQMKQNAWDLLPAIDYHSDFADAYVEELEESGDDDDPYYEDGDRDTNVFHSESFDDNNAYFANDGFRECVGDSSNQTPSCNADGGSPYLNLSKVFCSDTAVKSELYISGTAVKSEPDISPRVASAATLYSCSSLLFQDSKYSESMHNLDKNKAKTRNNINSAKVNGCSLSSLASLHSGLSTYSQEKPETEQKELKTQQKDVCNKQNTYINRYLAVQESCDETSMIAYSLVGFMLEEFAQAEGLDLDMSKRSYLRYDQSIEECNEEKLHSDNQEGAEDFVFSQAVENLIRTSRRV